MEGNKEYIPHNSESADAELHLSEAQAQQSTERQAEVLHAELSPEEQALLEKCDLVFEGPVGTSEIGAIKGTDENGNQIYLNRMYGSSYGKDFTVHAEIIAPGGDPAHPTWARDEDALAMWQKYDKVARIQSGLAHA